jgi:hypothetical protein
MLNEFWQNRRKIRENQPYLPKVYFSALTCFFMQKLYRTYDNDTLAMELDPGEEEQNQVLILELVVPTAAVPVLYQPVSTAARSMQHASVSSTVPGRVVTQLRVNNTALTTGWCTTATLVAAGPARRARL